MYTLVAGLAGCVWNMSMASTSANTNTNIMGLSRCWVVLLYALP